MSGHELTRWNRAGLDRLRYVNANAATLLEQWRAALEDRPELAVWEAIRLSEAERDEETPQRQARLSAQYQTPTRDPAWEIGRALARSAHILAGHVNADANEGYLGTATQWENIRRLVAMLDYSPAPPASASTTLALLARGERAGTVDPGLGVRYSPPAGGPPVVFETLEPIEVDPALNGLRLEGHDRSPAILSGRVLTLPGAPKDFAVDEPLVLEDERDGRLFAHRVAAVEADDAEGWTRVALVEPVAARWGLVLGATRVHRGVRERPRVSGPRAASVPPAASGDSRTVRLAIEPEGLRPGDYVYLGPSEGGRDSYRQVSEIDGRRVRVNAALRFVDVGDGFMTPARRLSTVATTHRDTAGGERIHTVRVIGDLRALQGQRIADVITVAAGREIPTFLVDRAQYVAPGESAPDGGGYTNLNFRDPDARLNNPQAFLVPPTGTGWPLEGFIRNDVDRPASRTLHTTEVRRVGLGEPVVLARGGQLAWGRLESLTAGEGGSGSRLSVERWWHRGGGRYWLGDTLLFAGFKSQLRPRGWGHNDTPLTGRWITPQAVPDTLTRGRRVLVVGEGADAVVQARVEHVAGGRVRLSEALDGRGMTVGNTLVRGNAVRSGHGESKPARVFGGADVTEDGLLFEKTGIAFEPDARLPGGVRAALSVHIEGERWEQVPNLHTSGPADRHYTVRVTEDGFLRLHFGDGRYGRRVPPGRGNIRIASREGVGPSGNLPAGRLEKLAKPHPRVEAVRQPQVATGGNSMESEDALREQAPSTLLTLQRAVSLSDYAHLAASHSSVWRARAVLGPVHAGRERRVDLVVVPAGGVFPPDLSRELHDYLRSHAPPGVRVGIRRFEDAPLGMRVVVRVNTGVFDGEKVKQAVIDRLAAAYALSARPIGEPVDVSQVYYAVESVTGVVNSRCFIDRDAVPDLGGGRRRVPAGGAEVLYLDDDLAGLAVDWEAYQP